MTDDTEDTEAPRCPTCDDPVTDPNRLRVAVSNDTGEVIGAHICWDHLRLYRSAMSAAAMMARLSDAKALDLVRRAIADGVDIHDGTDCHWTPPEVRDAIAEDFGAALGRVTGIEDLGL